ncbi:MAG: MoaD/ThiS family protein [Candidatus Eremiobacteraeota bacterium]|nr:MoaD/ThiS family protein [Candidatus Eremiobacteraeota bacterium]
MEVAPGTTAAAAFESLCAQHPALRAAAARVAFAVNQTQTTGDHVLNDADELAILPPMAGG